MAKGSVNKVILMGNLGKDPEMRYSPDGKAIANFSIATTEIWKDKATGKNADKTEWHRLVAFNRQAEIIGEYVGKGSKLYIEGRLQTRKWQNKDGVDQYTTEVVVDKLEMLGERKTQAAPQAESPESPLEKAGPDSHDMFDDDIPFN